MGIITANDASKRFLVMSLLIIGIIAWSLAHLFPAVFPDTRTRWMNKLGEGPYRGLFSLLILGALLLIVFGWKFASPSALYTPPLAAGPVTSVVILIGFVFFFASRAPGNIRRFIRHPQMAGTLLWAVAHLLTNGDSRSVALFGGLAIWALVEVVMMNRRDGAWQKSGPAAVRVDIVSVVIGFAAFALVFYFHSRLFGVSAVPI